MKNIEIIGGGTVSHVRNHLALTAPAYGNTARALFDYRFKMYGSDGEHDVHLHLTKMANQGQGNLETNEDISNLVDKLIAIPETRIIFFNPALVDYNACVLEAGIFDYHWTPAIFPSESGKYAERLKTYEGEKFLKLTPSDKIVSKIRKERKDIFLVAFKTTCGASEDEQFLTGLNLLKSNSCNLVLANDTKTRMNMIITPEQARYSVTTDRAKVLKELVTMTMARSSNTFTHSTVVPGDAVPWDMENIPHSLKAVVEHCIAKGAYKPFNGATVGHFAFNLGEGSFVTSKRKVDFNNLNKVGMVLCQAEGDDKVFAYGAKPSVGGQSQRIIFREHPETDCIVHFHCPPKPTAKLSVREQKMFECGSHECGKNTSDGLQETVSGIKCVYLDNHGPNIVFNHKTNPQDIIKFIDENFDLNKSTDQVNREV